MRKPRRTAPKPTPVATPAPPSSSILSEERAPGLGSEPPVSSGVSGVQPSAAAAAPLLVTPLPKALLTPLPPVLVTPLPPALPSALVLSPVPESSGGPSVDVPLEIGPSPAARTWARWMQYLADYHQCQVVDAHNVPAAGGGVFVGTHSLATYELFLAIYATRVLCHRHVFMVADRLFFKAPGLGRALDEIGFVQGTRASLTLQAKSGDLLGIAPGGMGEALRSSRQRFDFDWSKRFGFAAIACRAGVPVIPHACPQADYIYDVYPNPITDYVFRRFRLPLPIAFGRWSTPLPRPVKLVHIVGEPIVPDVAPDQVGEADIQKFHTRVATQMRALIARGVAMGDRAVGSDVRTLERAT